MNINKRIKDLKVVSPSPRMSAGVRNIELKEISVDSVLSMSKMEEKEINKDNNGPRNIFVILFVIPVYNLCVNPIFLRMILIYLIYLFGFAMVSL